MLTLTLSILWLIWAALVGLILAVAVLAVKEKQWILVVAMVVAAVTTALFLTQLIPSTPLQVYCNAGGIENAKVRP